MSSKDDEKYFKYNKAFWTQQKNQNCLVSIEVKISLQVQPLDERKATKI